MAIISPETLDFKKDVFPLTGKLRFPLTHDYMFTSSFQRNTYALQGFLSAMLGIPPDSITNLEILNPIQPGSSIDSKDIILDVKVCLNNLTIIDVEMQVAHYDYLPERFLFQLCRIYSGSLPKGTSYDALPPVIHIAIMDSELFPENDQRRTEEFLSEYYLMNPKNRKLYTGKFHLKVVSLKHVENAADKQNPNGIYRWGKLFKATTWKELNMIAENNSYMEAMASSVCTLCHDRKFVEECDRRLRNELEYNSRIAEASRKGMAQGIEAFILDNVEEGRSQNIILDKLVRRFSLSRDDAEKYYKQYVSKL